jgi:molybdenum cofactor cytidylyltransferase
MIRVERVALVLLAAGLSTRFGADDKLAAPLNSLPLGLHAASMAATLPFTARIAVTGARPPDFAAYGFTTVENDDPAAGQGRSIALGVQAARAHEVDAVLVILADMPFVTAVHIMAMLDAFDASHPVVASTTGDWSGPPALFGAVHFDILAQLSGDHGPRHLIRTGKLVAASPAELADIDTRRDLISAIIVATLP